MVIGLYQTPDLVKTSIEIAYNPSCMHRVSDQQVNMFARKPFYRNFNTFKCMHELCHLLVNQCKLKNEVRVLIDESNVKYSEESLLGSES